MYCVLLGTTIRCRHGHRAHVRLPFEPSTIYHPLNLYAPFTMLALSQLFLQALPPRIIHYGRCLYTVPGRAPSSLRLGWSCSHEGRCWWAIGLPGKSLNLFFLALLISSRLYGRLAKLWDELCIAANTGDIARVKHLVVRIVLQVGEILLLCFTGYVLETHRVGLAA
jgi:hypothetical protein